MFQSALSQTTLKKALPTHLNNVPPFKSWTSGHSMAPFNPQCLCTGGIWVPHHTWLSPNQKNPAGTPRCYTYTVFNMSTEKLCPPAVVCENHTLMLEPHLFNIRIILIFFCSIYLSKQHCCTLEIPPPTGTGTVMPTSHCNHSNADRNHTYNLFQRWFQ